ncbi:hypothetical protein AWB71_01957 [Caballeronia peredens]|nr:hypothetical protein AWB71_01957 [Caballeronia peredens]
MLDCFTINRAGFNLVIVFVKSNDDAARFGFQHANLPLRQFEERCKALSLQTLSIAA